MWKVPGVWPDDRGRREEQRRHSLHRKEHRLEGVRRTVLEVLLEEVPVDVLGEDTRRRRPISCDVSTNSWKDCKIKQCKYSKIIQSNMDKRTPALL
jgi:hypothetical protein